MDTDVIEAMAANGNLKAEDIMSNPEGAVELLFKYLKPISADHSIDKISEAFGLTGEKVEQWRQKVLYPLWEVDNTISETIVQMYNCRHHVEYHISFAFMMMSIHDAEKQKDGGFHEMIKKDLGKLADKLGIDLPAELKG